MLSKEVVQGALQSRRMTYLGKTRYCKPDWVSRCERGEPVAQMRGDPDLEIFGIPHLENIQATDVIGPGGINIFDDGTFFVSVAILFENRWIIAVNDFETAAA